MITINWAWKSSCLSYNDACGYLVLWSAMILAQNIRITYNRALLISLSITLWLDTLMQQDMAKAKKQSISIMIELEKIFPPVFFDIMIHVAIHLPDEAILGGPLRYRWMFPFERYMKKLKNYVRNKAKPERNDDGLPEEEPDKFQVFRSVCKPTGRMKETRLTTDVMQAVVWFVLNNSPEVDTDILAYREDSVALITWKLVFRVGLIYKEVDAPPVNDDNANANEDNADFINNEDDVVAHVLDDDDVVVSDDDEVNPSTNVEEMAVAPRSQLCYGFDYADLYLPSSRNLQAMLNRLMGETSSWPLPLACECYFNLAEWYNNQAKVVVGSNVYTVGERVRLGLELKLRLLWRKNKNRIKAGHYTKHDSPDETKNYPPPPRVWGDKTQDEWNELKVEKGHYEDLIETWRKTHSEPKSGRWKSKENKQRYLDMKAMQDRIKAGLIPFKTNQEILDEVVPSDNRQNMSGMGRKLPGGGSTSRRRANRAYRDARAYLALLKADTADQRANVAYQNTELIYGALGQFFMHYNSPNSARPFTPPAFSLVPPPPPGPTMPQLTPNLAHLLQPPFPYNQPLQPTQPPYPGPFPPTPVTNNNFNNCYRPVLNSTHCIPSSSNSQAHYTLLTNPHMNDSRSCDQLAQDLARENNNECSSGEEEEEARNNQ
ncbi:hypothetical protein Tco_1474561 [Tanacetum coccineum]